MKKLRFALPMLAIVMGIAFSAFTVQEKSTATVSDGWFEFIGNSTSQENDPAYYVFVGTSEPSLSCDAGSELVCKIEAEIDPNSPDPQNPQPNFSGGSFDVRTDVMVVRHVDLKDQ